MAKYFTISELIKSSTAVSLGLDNTPTGNTIENLNFLMDKVLDPIRTKWGEVLYVTSGYRSEKLNTLVGGSNTSYHRLGLAADLQCKNPTRFNIARLFNLVVELDRTEVISADQIIIEHNKQDRWWVHVSTKRNQDKNRHQYFSI